MDNLSIENENIVDTKKQDKKRNVVLIVIFVIAVLAVLFLINSLGERNKYITEQEKLKTLDELVKNSDSNKYTEQEKINILKKLSETNKENQQTTIEEKTKVLDSLTK